MSLWNPFAHASAIEPVINAIIVPAIGERWQLEASDHGDPWLREEYPPVIIKDVKNGWVRYYIGSWFRDERLPVDMFTKMYHRVGGPRT